jgi:hypothetical protein
MLKNQQIPPGQPLCGLGIFPEILSDFRESYISSLVNVKEFILLDLCLYLAKKDLGLCFVGPNGSSISLPSVHEVHIPSIASFTDSAHLSILREYMGLIL